VSLIYPETGERSQDIHSLIPFVAGIQALSLGTKIAIATTLAAALFSSGLYMGHQIGVSGCYEAQIKAQAHSIETGIKQAVVSDKTVTEYVDRVQIVQGKSREIIKEVKVYVQDTCTLSGGFRLLHDSAIYNELPDPARIVDEAPVSVADVAETVARNYGICEENAATLKALQSWVKEESAIR
jgi:hypothetical protein